ncbi:hypothetical protein Pint_00231 [Pistacia integerrima]|uniref:Uncharacterized protein n=1 Tax=Pistacia integerrima TaxID=434235 RepID=A0ACC0ZR96_9ROSI|nr:hypothetical protein Pint_00231 [Pistacia integerrima]
MMYDIIFVDLTGFLYAIAMGFFSSQTVESESLLKPILSAEEVPVCVHGTYKKYLESILESGLNRMKRLHVHFSSGLPTDGEVISGVSLTISGLIEELTWLSKKPSLVAKFELLEVMERSMRRDVNVLIFLDVRKALEDGMKLYMSDNRVILTEGFDGVVPVKYFEKVESWPDRGPIPL